MRFLFFRFHQLVEETGAETQKSAEALEAMRGRDPMEHRGRGRPGLGTLLTEGESERLPREAGPGAGAEFARLRSKESEHREGHPQSEGGRLLGWEGDAGRWDSRSPWRWLCGLLLVQ